MNDKIGRNDPCHCGSGKKYKKCCMTLLPTLKTAAVIDFEWRKLRQLEGAVFDRHLIPYATQELPDDIIKFAISDCLPDDVPDALDKGLLFNNFLLPWLLFNWIPCGNPGIEQFNPEITLAQNYMISHEDKLNSQERRFIEAMGETYYSYYSVLEVERDQSLLVKDILLGSTHTIKERQGTHQLKRGDITFSCILTLNNQSIFVGMASVIIPTRYHSSLLDYKQWLVEENDDQVLTAEILRTDFDIDLLDYFFETIKAAYNQPFPTLANTDGEPLQLSKSYFKLTMTPEETLSHLLPLTLSDDPEDFLKGAKQTQAGESKRIECPWLKKGNKQHQNWGNTLMGNIYIEPGRLILETNSEKRTDQGKQLLSKYLKEAILFQQTLIETPEQKLQSLPTPDPNNKAETEKLMTTPEVQKQLQAMAKSHWQKWFDEPIPDLDNETPRQAAKTPKGRERLDALLLLYERHDLEIGAHPFKADITYLKKELALE